MLPKIDLPTFKVTLPSTGVAYTFRPFVTKEEKLLLTAREEGTAQAAQRAIEQIITNCHVGGNAPPSRMTTVDLEWLFLQLRKNSVGAIVEQFYHDNEDNKDYKVTINLDEVKMPKVAKSELVQVQPGISIELQPPTADITLEMWEGKMDYDEVLSRCIIVHQDNGSMTLQPEPAEAKEWLDTLPVAVHDQLKAWLHKLPALSYSTSYTNSQGTVRDIELRRLTDFFAFY